MIYLQSDSGKTRPYNFDTACVMYAAIENEQNYRLTSMEEVMSGEFDTIIRSRPFVGTVEFMNEVFKRINKSPRVSLNSDRNSKTMSLGEARELILNGEVLFIKPKEIKLFTGSVIDKMFLSTLNPYPDDTVVLVYKPFDSPIISEWRCYVYMNKIVDARNYSGDFKTSINWNIVDNKVKNYNNFPIAYTVDIAVLENGDNVVVEFNDMWAIGNYGMDNTLYSRLLKDRYFEIIRG